MGLGVWGVGFRGVGFMGLGVWGVGFRLKPLGSMAYRVEACSGFRPCSLQTSKTCFFLGGLS